MNGFLIIFSLCIAATFAYGSFGEYGLEPETTFLVTMRKATFLNEPVKCVANSNDPRVCEQYNKCNAMFPIRIVTALNECRVSVTGRSWAQCNYGAPFLAPAPQREQIFDCITERACTRTPEERLAVVQAENCMRDLYNNYCV